MTVALLSLAKHVFVVMSQPHRSLKPHLVSHVNSVLGGGPLRSFQDLHHLRSVHGEDFGNLVSGHAHHTSGAADFLWEDVFGTWDAHGCAGKMAFEYKKDFTLDGHSPKNRQVTFLTFVTLPIDPLFDLRYDALEMLIPLLHWDGPNAQGGYRPETYWDSKS